MDRSPGVFLDIKSTIWGLVPEKWKIILYEFNVIMSKLGLILISLGSTFTHSSWSWYFWNVKSSVAFFTTEVIWREKFCNFSGLFFCFLFGFFFFLISVNTCRKKKKRKKKTLQEFSTKRTTFCVFLESILSGNRGTQQRQFGLRELLPR